MFKNFNWPFGKNFLTSLFPTKPAPRKITIEGEDKPINYLYRMLIDRLTCFYQFDFITSLASQEHLLLGFLGPFTVDHPRNRDFKGDYTLIITDEKWPMPEEAAYKYCRVCYTATTYDKHFQYRDSTKMGEGVESGARLRAGHAQSLTQQAKHAKDTAFVLIEYTLINIKNKKRFIHAYFSYNLEVLEGKKEAAAMAEV